MWVQLAMPASMLFSGYLLLITKRFLVTERGKIRSDEESAESNRMLGLAFQQQGQLDMALEKFRKCPLDDSMMEPFYNLALDFERKRQFNKATSIYEYLVKHDAKFKDIQSRMDQSKQMSDTFMFGQAGGGGAGASLIIDASGVEKPMLGRYEVEKELGKGAMGVVYLGKDPKINRTVAIKTMALAQEFEADELEEVTSRFFREAETAGRLSHPNIVSIFDAGEEHDLAYIAMEFLKGRDLDLYTKKDKLLPIIKVLELMALAADALGYAHKQNVVHRDIKPANIMYDPETNEFKITDFGIARITDSSKTKTGMILGTPSYMSPEQLSGKKVGGSSDLFSLGVMLYQLLCGELPFKGESMSSLMFMIASDPHRDIVTFRPELAKEAPCTIQIINKALEKDPDKRFQSGEVLAQYLRKCAQIISKAQAI
jgi:serine/threonine-protein kinase